MRGAQNKKVPNESVALLTLNTNAKKKNQKIWECQHNMILRENVKTTENWKNQD